MSLAEIFLVSLFLHPFLFCSLSFPHSLSYLSPFAEKSIFLHRPLCLRRVQPYGVVNNAQVFHNSSEGGSTHHKTLSEVGLLNQLGYNLFYWGQGKVKVKMSQKKISAARAHYPTLIPIETKRRIQTGDAQFPKSLSALLLWCTAEILQSGCAWSPADR